MDRKTVRIITNENKRYCPPFYRSCEYHHSQGLMNFIYHNDINIEEQSLDSMYISKELTAQGFCVILTTEDKDIRYMEIFIPETISLGQLEYFKQEKIKSELTKSEIKLYKYSKEDKLEVTTKITTKVPVINELISELYVRQEKVKSNNKVKQLSQNHSKN